MRLPSFTYIKPDNLASVLDSLHTHQEDAQIIAGGTDLLVRMKKGLIKPKVLISLKTLESLSYIVKGNGLIRIGAKTALTEIIRSNLLKESATALITACESVGAQTIQHHCGTLGGNILQDNRCIHYNQSEFQRSGHQPCHKAGGKICYAREVADRCFSTCQSDGATALMALDAKVVLVNKQGERTIDLEELYSTDGIMPFTIKSNELLKEIIIPVPAGNSAYYRIASRSAIDYPMVCAAVSIKSSDNLVDEVRIVVGSMGRSPMYLAQASSFLSGKDITDKTIFKEAAAKARNSSEPFAVHNVAGTTLEYRNEMVEPVVFRALEKAAEGALNTIG